MWIHGHAGKTQSPTYVSWKMMIQRCQNRNREDYAYYGGRGICVYFGWLGPGGFEEFLRDVGERPGREYCLGRIDHDKDYEPGNVAWQLIPENCATSEGRAHLIKEVDGIAMSLSEWADHLNIKYESLLKRIQRGWGDDAFRYMRGERRGVWSWRQALCAGGCGSARGEQEREEPLVQC